MLVHRRKSVFVFAMMLTASLGPALAQPDGGPAPRHEYHPIGGTLQGLVGRGKADLVSIRDCRLQDQRARAKALARPAGDDAAALLELRIVDGTGVAVDGAELLIAQRRRPWRCLAFSANHDGMVSLELRRPKRRHDLLLSAPGFRPRFMTWSPPLEPEEQHTIALTRRRARAGPTR